MTWQSGTLALLVLVVIGVVTSTYPGAPGLAAAAGRGAALRDVADVARWLAGPGSLPDIVREAGVGLARNRVRAGLSMLGISWGIVSVVMLLSYGNGFQAALERGFRGAFGDGVVIAWPGQTSAQAGGERAGKRFSSPKPTCCRCATCRS